MQREEGFYRCSNPQAAGSSGDLKLFHPLQEADVFRSCWIAVLLLLPSEAVVEDKHMYKLVANTIFCVCTMSLSVFSWVVIAVWSYLLYCGSAERLILKEICFYSGLNARQTCSFTDAIKDVVLMLQFAMHILPYTGRHFKYLATFFCITMCKLFLWFSRKAFPSHLCAVVSVSLYKPLVSGRDGLPNHWHADVLASSVALVLIMQMGLSSQRKSSDTLRLWDHVTFSYLQCVQDVSGVVWLLGASHLPLPLPPWKRCQEHGSYPYRVYAKANVYLLFQSHSVRRQGLLQSFTQALISLNI